MGGLQGCVQQRLMVPAACGLLAERDARAAIHAAAVAETQWRAANMVSWPT